MTEENTGMDISEILNRIQELKQERGAVILAHNYQIAGIQDAADFVGDSLDLSIKASRIDSEVVVFCGVHFMAETAAILAEDKTVLIPEPGAGCPMADMITGEQLRNWKKQRPGRPVVCYVNTTAEVKAESDICCTSANALAVVESLDADEILFAPDKNLAAYVQRLTKKTIIPWNGHCYVHNQIRSVDIKLRKEDFPEAEVWVHPECRPEVIDLADRVLSTGGMVRDAGTAEVEQIIIGTETGIIHRLEKENPGKRFIAARSLAVCHNMKKITVPKLLDSLENRRHRVEVAPAVAEKAKQAIERMLRIKREK